MHSTEKKLSNKDKRCMELLQTVKVLFEVLDNKSLFNK